MTKINHEQRTWTILIYLEQPYKRSITPQTHKPGYKHQNSTGGSIVSETECENDTSFNEEKF